MAVWPIPKKPLRQGYAPTHTPSTIRTAMEQGPDRMTLLHDEIVTSIPVAVYVTADEYQTFVNWYRNTIKITQWFDVDIVTQGVLTSHSARIVGPLGSTPMGLGYRLTMVLETNEFQA